MNYNEFFAAQKAGALKGMYLLHGPEEYTKQSAVAQLQQSLPPEARELNVQTFERPAADMVRVTCETLPFFAERRIVICREMAEQELRALLPYVPDLPDSTLLVLVLRGSGGAALIKAVQEVGTEVLFDVLNDSTAARFVLDRAKKAGVSMDRRAAALLVDMVGTDVHTLENELNKVLDYAGRAGTILEDFITAAVTPHPEYQRFRMLDDFLAGRSQKAMRAMASMLRDGAESVFALAHFFTGQCKSMLLARLLLDSGANEKEIARRLNLYPRAAASAVRGARRQSAEALRQAVQDFSEIDFLQVSGRAQGEQVLMAAAARYFCEQ